MNVNSMLDTLTELSLYNDYDNYADEQLEPDVIKLINELTAAIDTSH